MKIFRNQTRVHVEFSNQGNEMLEAQLTIASLLTLVDALQHASIPGLEISNGYEVRVAFRATYADVGEPLNATGRQSVKCRGVDVTRRVVNHFILQIRSKLDGTGVSERDSRSGKVVTISSGADHYVLEDESIEDRCGKYNEKSYYLIEAGKDRSLERLAYELGYSVTHSTDVDRWLTKDIVANDACGRIPALRRDASETPREMYVRSTFPVLYDDLLRGLDETGVAICKLPHDRTTVPQAKQRWGVTQTGQPPSSLFQSANELACYWMVLLRQ